MAIGTVIFLMVGLSGLAFFYWDQLFPVPRKSSSQTAAVLYVNVGFLIWTIQGLLFPALFWVLVNADLLPGIAPFLPNVAVAKYGGGRWLSILFDSTAPGLLAICIYWTSATFAWMAARITADAKERNELIAIAIIWCVLLSPFIWVSLRRFGLGGVPLGLLISLVPFVHCTLSLALKPRVGPTYSRAIAKMKFGKYTEAEQQVIQELEKRQDDFEGWMMLADLYANHFHELSEADATIRTVCNEPNTTAVQVSLAFNRLADWHLKLADNPVAARAALDQICQRYPGTTFARSARLRIEQMPANREEVRELKKTKTIRLPALNDQLNEPPAADIRRPEWTRDQAVDQMNQCVRKLTQNPNDIPVREKMALLLAERLGKPELGIEQLDLLMGMPDPAPRKVAEWLGLIASWHVKYRNDISSARKVMERLIHEYPETPQAFAAQRHLNLWDVENHIRKARAVTAA